MQERDVVTGSAFSNSARSKAHTLIVKVVRRADTAEEWTRLGCEPLHSEGKVIDPKTDVVEGSAVHSLSHSVREEGKD